MKKIADILTFELEAAFEKAGYDKQYAKVTLSNRPDLCEYQCNGAMAAAKAYKKAPIMIANDVVEVLKESVCIEQVEAVNPGFINIILDGEFGISGCCLWCTDRRERFSNPCYPLTFINHSRMADVAIWK